METPPLDDPARWREAKALFDEVVDQPPAARAARLAHADPALRTAVEALLAADADADGRSGGFLDTPPAPPLDAPAAAGRRIGPYRVLRPLGEGGMGEVVLAERADGAFEKAVALKLVKRGMDTAAVLRRFHAERRILARLDHPGIARLLDGGEAPDGRPWLAMEYVEGHPITEWAERRALPLPARLALFAQVVEAVRHAHARLVVHRDLKPSNVLVCEDDDGAPVVKLLDFGIARLLEGDEPEASALTAAGVRPMTRAYAAPEQLRGEPVTTATDVYALGVLLYELLTGRRPFEAASASALEAAILTREPARPSAALRGGAAGDPAAYRRLRGDLDTLVLKALAKAPPDRYATADALLDDLRRYLDGQPLAARPPRAAYRVRKFVGRHPAGVAMTTALALVLAVGGTLYTLRVRAERDLAEAARTRAERTAAFLYSVFDHADPTQGSPDATTARELLDAGAARVHDELAEEPAARAEMLTVLGRVYGMLGLWARADTTLREAVALHRAGAADPASHRDALLNLSNVHYRRGDLRGAEALVREALRVRVPPPPDGAVDFERLSALNTLATILSQSDRVEASAALLAEVIRQRRGVPGEEANLAANLSNYGSSLLDLGRTDEACGALDEAHALVRDARGPGHPYVAFARNMRGTCYQKQGRMAEAEADFRTALTLGGRTLGDAHPFMSAAHQNLADLLLDLGRPTEAAAAYARAASIASATDGSPADVADAEVGLARAHLATGHAAEAVPLLDRATPVFRDALGPAHPRTLRAMAALAEAHTRLGAYDAASRVLADARRARRGAPADSGAAAALEQARAAWDAARMRTRQGA